MSNGDENNGWILEIIKRLPWSATFIIASFFFFREENQIAGWVCLSIAIVALILVIKFEYYEKIIDRQEKQIIKYSNQTIKTQTAATENISKLHTAIGEGSKYKKEGNATDIS